MNVVVSYGRHWHWHRCCVCWVSWHIVLPEGKKLTEILHMTGSCLIRTQIVTAAVNDSFDNVLVCAHLRFSCCADSVSIMIIPGCAMCRSQSINSDISQTSPIPSIPRMIPHDNPIGSPSVYTLTVSCLRFLCLNRVDRQTSWLTTLVA